MCPPLARAGLCTASSLRRPDIRRVGHLASTFHHHTPFIYSNRLLVRTVRALRAKKLDAEIDAIIEETEIDDAYGQRLGGRGRVVHQNAQHFERL